MAGTIESKAPAPQPQSPAPPSTPSPPGAPAPAHRFRDALGMKRKSQEDTPTAHKKKRTSFYTIGMTSDDSAPLFTPTHSPVVTTNQLTVPEKDEVNLYVASDDDKTTETSSNFIPAAANSNSADEEDDVESGFLVGPVVDELLSTLPKLHPQDWAQDENEPRDVYLENVCAHIERIEVAETINLIGAA